MGIWIMTLCERPSSSYSSHVIPFHTPSHLFTQRERLLEQRLRLGELLALHEDAREVVERVARRRVVVAEDLPAKLLEGGW